MDKINISNLSGKCLVALPTANSNFYETIVYICSHNKDGAMGFIINKPHTTFTFSEISFNLPFSNQIGPSIPIFQGGPMERDKGFIIHDQSYSDAKSFEVANGISVTSSPEIIQAITTGHAPKNFMIVLGYAGWLPNQLENEISQNLWMVVPATHELLFKTPIDDRWALSLLSLGINATNLCLPIGHS